MTLLALTVSGCAGRGSEPPLDLVLITLDTTRSDRLGSGGFPDARTPHLDALAASGVQFVRATTVSTNTLPAHVSMLTGRYPQSAGVPRNGFPLSEGVPLVSEILSRAGYETAAFVSAAALDGRLGLTRGFATYDDSFDVVETDQAQRIAETTIDAAVEWLETPRERPMFLWVHAFDPHYPYTPPPPYDFYPTPYKGQADGSIEYVMKVQGRGHPVSPMTRADEVHMTERYEAEIRYLDDQLGKLFDAIERRSAGSTLIILAADHGEGLTEHGELFDHGQYVFESTLWVPLFVIPPRKWNAVRRVHTGPAQVLDAAPTLLDAAGVEIPPEIQGESLVSPVCDGHDLARKVAFAESCRPWRIEEQWKGSYRNVAKAQSATRWPWKLIVTPYQKGLVLLNLARDPGEFRDVSERHPRIVEELASAIEDWREGELRYSAPDAQNLERIKALGYLE
jgi:arylsulfatase A-like enzyme